MNAIQIPDTLQINTATLQLHPSLPTEPTISLRHINPRYPFSRPTRSAGLMHSISAVSRCGRGSLISENVEAYNIRKDRCTQCEPASSSVYAEGGESWWLCVADGVACIYDAASVGVAAFADRIEAERYLLSLPRCPLRGYCRAEDQTAPIQGRV